jgi:hypothetical protein
MPARAPSYDLRSSRRRWREIPAPRPIPRVELALFHDRGSSQPRQVAIDCLPALFTRLEGATTLRRWQRDGAQRSPAIYREVAPIAYRRVPGPRDAAQSFDG